MNSPTPFELNNKFPNSENTSTIGSQMTDVTPVAKQTGDIGPTKSFLNISQFWFQEAGGNQVVC